MRTGSFAAMFSSILPEKKELFGWECKDENVTLRKALYKIKKF